MLFGVAKGFCTVHAEAYAMVGFGEILEEVEDRATLPGFKVDSLLCSCNNLAHASMLIAGL